MTVDVAVPADRNVIKKDTESIIKYRDRTVEVQRMWNVTAQLIPVGAVPTGTISESLNTGKARHGTIENRHIGHCTLTDGSGDAILPSTATGWKPICS